MDRIFKIRCSQIWKIMGRIGLSDAQEKKLSELSERKVSGSKPLTDNMEFELDSLIRFKSNPKLPDTCTTYLKEWYANDNEEIYSKQVTKGNMMESESIDFMCQVLGLGVADKNRERRSDDFIEGECDVDCAQVDATIDNKCPWNNKNLHDHTFALDPEYRWQGQGYMHLWKRSRHIVFYGLMDTPEDANYGNEVIYSNLPDEKRWVGYSFKYDPILIGQVAERVVLCRAWLENYSKEVESKLGRIIEV